MLSKIKNRIFVLTTALSVGLFASCISDDETTEVVFEEDLRKIADYVDNSSIVPLKEVTVGESGVTMLFTEVNDGGLAPVVGDSLMVDYTGYLLDGTVFDTSIEQVARDNNVHNPNRDYAPFPIVLGYSDVIGGWHIALSQMKEGEKATVLIPSIYGYGPRGSSNGAIRPNTVLAFDLELVEVIKP